MTDPNALQAAAGDVARLYGRELAAAARCLAEACGGDERTFANIWSGIGELCRAGIFDFVAAESAESSTTAPTGATNQGDSNDIEH
ncbi:hypothetical protein F1C58_08380 [Glaciihabitans sp. INWT7]|uniref:hypothetical protein n=1 Tax=Glaciihabitans sp. INWT7 TaxID=2596912 RepID=UPI00162AE13E|nr:hypothetical protein [Glaciihabitans sp. INWT7]QNE46917.1 hypothetical protein F1C58_08380 [Glaciihabitans sp. INWT7]